MDTRKKAERNVLNVIILILSFLAGGVGLVALLGCVLKMPQGVNCGTDLIPMAPSTALLFMMGGFLFGVGACVRLIWRRQRIQFDRERLVNPDITKRKRAEEALLECENKFRSLVFHMTEGVALHEMIYAEDGRAVNYRILDVNPAFERHTGIKAVDAQGRLATEVYHVKVAPYLELYEKVVRSGEANFFVTDLPQLKRIFSVSAYFLKPGLFATVFADITQRVKTEESHARLATAVEQAAETIMITDSEGLILYANPAFEKVTGYSCEEANGQNPRILKSGKHDEAFYRQMWGILRAGKVWSGRIINKGKDGSLYEEEASISPVLDASGKITNFVAVKRDVTREVQLEQQFMQAQKMEAIGRLAGGVAHDFNNILSVILMNASELSDNKSNTPAQTSEAKEIILAAERGANLTRQMLAFSRRQVMQRRILDINEVVSGIVNMLRRIIGEDIVLQTHPLTETVLVWGDSGMIEQALLNLAVNARDAMPDGGQLVIELDTLVVDESLAQSHKVKAGDFVRLTFRDNGLGISPESLPHIFEPFFTTKAIGKGTGLGLATLHGIVEQHHGWVEAESEEGKGSTFFVYLPRMSSAQKGHTEMQATVAPEGGVETILLVEDEQFLRGLAVRILKHYGYRVLEAPSGAAGLKIWREHSSEVNLLLTDVIMPGGLSGCKLAGMLLAEKPELKIIYMSGYPGEMEEAGFNLGPSRKFLQKPFSPNKLALMVRECLDSLPSGRGVI